MPRVSQSPQFLIVTVSVLFSLCPSLSVVTRRRRCLGLDQFTYIEIGGWNQGRNCSPFPLLGPATVLVTEFKMSTRPISSANAGTQ
ncbi:hypothetical protein GGR51DRAFT_543850 [Nemania sp. FL0031]|nr:hypothetical protein GGR51DRAFT_543850 [Nemania sp. FL0031]